MSPPVVAGHAYGFEAWVSLLQLRDRLGGRRVLFDLDAPSLPAQPAAPVADPPTRIAAPRMSPLSPLPERDHVA